MGKRLSSPSPCLNRRMLNTRRGYLSSKRQLTYLNDVSERHIWRNSLRIAGIPEGLGEDTEEQVLDLARDIDVDISLNDIDRSHRVGKQGLINHET